MNDPQDILTVDKVNAQLKQDSGGLFAFVVGACGGPEKYVAIRQRGLFLPSRGGSIPKKANAAKKRLKKHGHLKKLGLSSLESLLPAAVPSPLSARPTAASTPEELFRQLLRQLRTDNPSIKQRAAFKLFREWWKTCDEALKVVQVKKRKKNGIPRRVLSQLSALKAQAYARQLGCTVEELPSLRNKERLRLNPKAWESMVREVYPAGLANVRRIQNEVYEYERHISEQKPSKKITSHKAKKRRKRQHK